MQSLGGSRILVVEDNAAYRRTVVRILEPAGFVLIEAADFVQALTIIESGQPLDLLLSDIGLGTGALHGFSIGAIARARRPALAVVYMTGDEDPTQFSLNAGDSIVLRKPFTGDVLVATIRAALAGR
jgi:CheY-like chemotaxis protein